MTKTLGNTDSNPVTKNVPDVVTWGHPSRFKLICKASSQIEGWMKSTKAMAVHGGCLVQVTTQQRNPNGSYSVAEALTFVPGVTIYSLTDNDEGEGEVVDRWLGADCDELPGGAVPQPPSPGNAQSGLVNLNDQYQPLPVSGYTEQSGMAVATVNINKQIEEQVLQRLDFLASQSEIDKRWLAIARENIEQGFMAANRAVFKPERVQLNDPFPPKPE